MFKPYRIVSAALAGALIGGVVAAVTLVSVRPEGGLEPWAWIGLGIVTGAVLAGFGQGVRNLFFRLFKRGAKGT